MINFFNKVFIVFKILFLIVSFVLTLYILLNMYANLGKSPFGSDMWEFISVLIPYVLLLTLFVINMVGRQKRINDNTFYNVTCFIVLGSILYIAYRAMCDQNMILWHKTNMNINFDYFADQILQIKTMIYGLSFTNIILMIESRLEKKKELFIAD